jgi:hypothetical protein
MRAGDQTAEPLRLGLARLVGQIADPVHTACVLAPLPALPLVPSTKHPRRHSLPLGISLLTVSGLVHFRVGIKWRGVEARGFLLPRPLIALLSPVGSSELARRSAGKTPPESRPLVGGVTRRSHSPSTRLARVRRSAACPIGPHPQQVAHSIEARFILHERQLAKEVAEVAKPLGLDVTDRLISSPGVETAHPTKHPHCTLACRTGKVICVVEDCRFLGVPVDWALRSL